MNARSLGVFFLFAAACSDASHTISPDAALDGDSGPDVDVAGDAPLPTETRWLETLSQDSTPDEAGGASLVFDTEWSRLVLMGGLGPYGYVWTLDGTQWTKIRPTDGTFGQRASFGAAYDAERHRLVVFGGETPEGMSDETLEWDGIAWHLAATTAPTGRGSPAMTYDSSRHQIVLFGGTDGRSAFADTWTYDGTTWTRMDPTGSVPPGRSSGQAVFDSVRERVVLFGGLGPSSGHLNDLWEWDGARWTEITQPSPRPSARRHHQLAYDSARQRVVLFGGSNTAANTNSLSDLWEWDGTRWTEVESAGLAPEGKHWHAMAYDPMGRRTVVFGGVTAHRGGSALAPETWAWDGTSWTDLTALPHSRTRTTETYDPVGGRILLYGGQPILIERTVGRYYDDLWEHTDGVWRRIAVDALGSGKAGAAMAYDGEEMIIFGGQGADGYAVGTWALDASGHGRRIDATAGDAPHPRAGHRMVLDEARAQVVLFGGCDASSCASDTWVWDGARWRDVTPGASPPARELAVMVYDAFRSRVVLFGGRDQDLQGLDDLWEWDGSSWTELDLDVAPSGRYLAMGSYDEARHVTIVMGGLSRPGGIILDDRWEWDGVQWTERADSDGPIERFGGAMVFDPLRRRSILAGGAGDGSPTTGEGSIRRDSWELVVE